MTNIQKAVETIKDKMTRRYRKNVNCSTCKEPVYVDGDMTDREVAETICQPCKEDEYDQADADNDAYDYYNENQRD